MTDRTARGWVAGRVQGVAYRASLMHKATGLGLTGWVRNLPDGRVAFLVHGEPSQVQLLLAWARRGPPFARVDQIHAEDVENEPSGNFEIRY